MSKANYRNILRHLKRNVSPVFLGSLQWSQIVELFQKELPKKPIIPNDGDYNDYASSGLCPNCKSVHIYDYEYDRKFKRCSDCGQLLDWNNEEAYKR